MTVFTFDDKVFESFRRDQSQCSFFIFILVALLVTRSPGNKCIFLLCGMIESQKNDVDTLDIKAKSMHLRIYVIVVLVRAQLH